jgi:hypothetical protein
MLLGVAEVALGISLILRPVSATLWLTGGLLFSVFFVVSLSQARAGVQVCDCFGALVSRPRNTALIDLVAAIVCWLSWNGARRLPSPAIASYGIPALRLTGVFVTTFFALMFARERCTGDLKYGVAPIVAQLRLNAIDSSSAWLDGSALIATRGGRQLRVLGCEQGCGLRVGRELPFNIEPESYVRVPIKIRKPSDAAVGLVPLTLFLEIDGVLEKITIVLPTPNLYRG